MTNTRDRGLSMSAAQALRLRTEATVGKDRVDVWLGDSAPVHRLGVLLRRVDEYANGRLNEVAEDAALLSAAELDSVLTLAEAWQASPSWTDVRRGLRDAGEFFHAVGTLAVGSMLRERHPSTHLVVSTPGGREPDVMLEVPEAETLAVEVKARPRLRQPTHALGLAESLAVVRTSLSSAGWASGQLRAGRPGVLAVAGLLMPQSTYDLLVQSFKVTLQDRGIQWPHILGLAVFNLRLRPELEGGRVTVASEQQSVLRRNPNYRGRLWIDDDWSRPWRLVQR
jgi:hypothetical protein